MQRHTNTLCRKASGRREVGWGSQREGRERIRREVGKMELERERERNDEEMEDREGREKRWKEGRQRGVG